MSQASPHAARRDISIYAWDAHIIVGSDETALLRLWREKRGEAEPYGPSLIERLGYAIEALSRECYEAHTGHKISMNLKRAWDPALFWMSTVVEGTVAETGALFETAFLLPPAT